MRIGLARRGYSSTGGAESYLGRLADGLKEAGHDCVLFAGPEWPRAAWSGPGFQPMAGGTSPRAFADRVDRAREKGECDLLFSLERLWRCDCYRAGDGVHRAWLARRSRAEPGLRSWLRDLNPKHRQILALEKSLFAQRGARFVIANSRMVRDEIVEHYGYPSAQIKVVYNGLDPEPFRVPERRAATRTLLGLRETDCAMLFAGSGWERKGLRHALGALEILSARGAKSNSVLLVAGRGNPKPYLARVAPGTRARVKFLGPVSDMPACYAAADLFVLPTLYDPFSNACLEARASGLPVITTRANGFSEIITNEWEGRVVDEQSPNFQQVLAQAIGTWAQPGQRIQTPVHSMRTNLRETLDVLVNLHSEPRGGGLTVD